MVATVDMMVEDVDFRLTTASFEDIGHKALAVNLSDLAAMGAEPVAALVALGIPGHVTHEDVLRMYAAMETLAAASGTTIAGGDISSAPVLTIAITAIGRIPDSRSAVVRSSARVGDGIFVTGPIGGSAAGLAILEGHVPASLTPHADALMAAHRRPHPRLAEGVRFAEAGIHAMLDCSDGLCLDTRRLASASGVRIELDLDAVPLAAGVQEVAAALNQDPAIFAATGGEDFELIVSAPDSLCAGLIRIGSVVDGPAGLVLRRDGQDIELQTLGFVHDVARPIVKGV